MILTIRKTFKGDVKSVKKERTEDEIREAFKEACQDVKEGKTSKCRLWTKTRFDFKRFIFDRVDARFENLDKFIKVYGHAFSNFLNRNKGKIERIILSIDYLN